MERLTHRLLLGWALYGALTLATVLLLLWYRGVFLPCRSSRTAQAELGGRPCTLTLENGAFAVQDGKTELWRSEAAELEPAPLYLQLAKRRPRPAVDVQRAAPAGQGLGRAAGRPAADHHAAR